MSYCPDAPLEPPAPTYRQEIANDIFHKLEAAEKKFDKLSDEFDDVDYEISQYKYLTEELKEKVRNFYTEQICNLKDEITDIKSVLIDLGYAPD